MRKLSPVLQTTTPYTNGQPGTPTTLTFAYDGHGSTRVLLDLAGAIASVAGLRQVFQFDAYGNLLNMAASQAATSLLYSGEMFDQRVMMQYLRARWYDAGTGRFGSLDPYFGSMQDPQSLHKYLYTHADPINGVDPTGMITAVQGIAALGIALNLVSFQIHYSSFVTNTRKGDSAAAASDFLWAMVDLIFLALPFAGPGASAGRYAFQLIDGYVLQARTLSQVGVAASAIWGYLNVVVATVANSGGGSVGSGGGSSSSSSSSSSPGSWGEPPHKVGGRAAEYQAKIASQFGDPPPQPGWEYQVDGRWFDGVNQSAKKLLEAKGYGYEQLFDDLVDARDITAPLDKIKETLAEYAKIAQRHGYTLEVHVAEARAAQRIQSVAPSGVTVVHTP